MFPADTSVWVDGALVQMSKVTAGQTVRKGGVVVRDWQGIMLAVIYC